MNQPAVAAIRAEQESAWRDRLSRFAASGQTIKAFCAAEAVSAWSFYRWRKLLGMAEGQTAASPRAQPAPFIDLGALPATARLPDQSDPGIAIRLELGGGMVLQITRR